MFERVILNRLNDHLWLMDDHHEATGYLVVGRDKVLVIDTMNGFENLPAIVRTVTNKPVIVVNTHGHCDHILGNAGFEKALLNEKDKQIAVIHGEGKELPPFEPIREGDVIDLGGLTLEVFELPGHTPGSICLLLREDRILFTGDAVNRHLWLQLDESLSVRQTMENMDRIASVKDRADYILHGHARGFEPIALFDQLREGLRQLCEENVADDADYKWFGGMAKQHVFDRDSVIVYTESKLDRAPFEAPNLIDVPDYTRKLTAELQKRFRDRLCYVGLQGSYLRGEATEESDIDIMTVIDGLNQNDLEQYRDTLAAIGDDGRACGFICGKKELANWNPLEIGHVLHSTKDIYGTLRELIPAYSQKDIADYIKVNTGNLYHAICHRYIYKGDENISRFERDVFFILQNVYYLETGKFIRTRREMDVQLNDQDQKVWDALHHEKSDAFALLMDWCGAILERAGRYDTL